MTLSLVACADPTTSTPVAEPTPSLPEAFVEEPPAEPEPSPSPVAHLLFATKTLEAVEVFAFDPRSGETRLLTSYTESYPADIESGNYHRMNVPSVALSPDGTTLAIAAASGLILHRLSDADRDRLIVRVEPGYEELPAVWDPPLEGTYGLAEPRWSSDGRTISVDRIAYEGMQAQLVDRKSRAVVEIEDMPFEYVSRGDLSWASEAPVWVAPLSEQGWVMGDANDPTHFTRARLDIARTVVFARVSAAGSHVVAIDRPHWGEDPARVLVANGDGSDPVVVAEGSDIGSAILSRDGRVAWWIGGDAVGGGTLHRAGIENAAIATLEAGFHWSILDWWDDGLAVFGRDREGDRASLLLIDRETGETVLRHDSHTAFTTYLGRAVLPQHPQA